mgnify:CR=1 FL=1
MNFFWLNGEADLSKLRIQLHLLEQEVDGLRAQNCIVRDQLAKLEKEMRLKYPSEFWNSKSSILRALAPCVPLATAVTLLMQRAGIELRYVPEHPAHYTLEPVAKPKKV